MTGIDSLIRDLDSIDQVLEAFDHPSIEERPSSRLLRDTLVQRRASISAKLASARRDTLTLDISGAERPTARSVVDVLAVVLDLLGDRLDDLREDATGRQVEATTLRLDELAHDDETTTATLVGPDLDREVVPRTDDGQPILALALREVVEALAQDDDAVEPLRAVLDAGVAVVDVRSTGALGEDRVRVDGRGVVDS